MFSLRTLSLFFTLYERARLAPYELIHVRASQHPATVRRSAAGWAQAWRKMYHLVVFDNDLDPLGVSLGDTEAAQKNVSQILRIAHVLLCDEITKSWLWPT